MKLTKKVNKGVSLSTDASQWDPKYLLELVEDREELHLQTPRTAH